MAGATLKGCCQKSSTFFATNAPVTTSPGLSLDAIVFKVMRLFKWKVLRLFQIRGPFRPLHVQVMEMCVQRCPARRHTPRGST
eukprot:symbB.v1.2.014153.t1/scaffold1028.1/size143234/5